MKPLGAFLFVFFGSAILFGAAELTRKDIDAKYSELAAKTILRYVRA